MQGKLAILAGNGKLPQILIDSCLSKKQEFILFLLEGQKYDIDYSQYNPVLINYGGVGKFVDILKRENISDIVFIGGVKKPNFAQLKMDKLAALLVGKILANKILGDDAVLKTVVKFFKKQGFNIIAIDDILDCVVSKKGCLTTVRPSEEDMHNIEIGKKAISSFSKFDVGQSVIVAQRQIIAVEAVEGTANMIQRVKNLEVDYKNESILVKMKKKKQSRQADLPTIGVDTILDCKKSSIKGIAIQAKSTILVEKETLINKANDLKIFIQII